MIRFFEIDCDNLNFDIFVFDEVFYKIYILFIYIIHNLSKVFIYFFIVYHRLESINLWIIDKRF